MEIWKIIPNTEECYEASSMGRIRSRDREVPHPRNRDMVLPRRGKILKSELDRSGYPVVTLSIRNKQRTCKVHRLVAQAFIPNPDNLPQIDHINCKRYDNRPENLRWCTSQDNMKWRDENHEIGDRARYTVICKETKQKFTSTYHAAFWIINKGLTPRTTNYKSVAKAIRGNCTGRTKSSYGFHWAYLEGSTTISKESRGNSPRNGKPRIKAGEDIV